MLEKQENVQEQNWIGISQKNRFRIYGGKIIYLKGQISRSWDIIKISIGFLAMVFACSLRQQYSTIYTWV